MMKKLAVLIVVLPGAAFSQDVEHGRALASRWCANCHVVSRDAATGQANGLPTFPAMADNPATTSASLRGAMTVRHSRMPDFSLTTRDREDLVGYIFSLRRK